MFHVAAKKRLGDFTLDISFESHTPVTALFGPSGSGKTSVSNAISGLLRPDAGKIVVGGKTLFDSDHGTNIPVHRRKIRVVFQESRLFPHLNVRQNLLYGRWLAGKRAGAELNEIASFLGLEALLSRHPRTLSGGERQRVAIGRALLAEPEALLLDEPLASLDRARKQEIFPYLETLVANARIPILYVSHAWEEIERLAQTVVRLEDGRVKSIDPLKPWSASA